MPTPERIYLDNAATTWPKPESVYVAVEQMMRGNGAAVGRAVFGDSANATQVVQQARRELAKLINADFESSVVFTNSGTDSLSTAILGLLKPEDSVVTTAAEHNSVLRPLHHLKKTIGVQLNIVACDATGLVATSDLVDAIDQRDSPACDQSCQQRDGCCSTSSGDDCCCESEESEVDRVAGRCSVVGAIADRRE